MLLLKQEEGSCPLCNHVISLLFYEIFVAPTSNAKDYPAIMCVLEVGYGRRSISAGLFTKLSAAMTEAHPISFLPVRPKQSF